MNNRRGSTVTIWTATTRQALALPEAADSLSEEEAAQADRLKQISDRDRFLAARVLLRHVLTRTVAETQGSYIPAARWRYRAGEYGKLMMAPDLPQLEFNLSHSGNCVAVGVANTGPVGVDIEISLSGDDLEFIQDALSGREKGFLRQLADDQQKVALLQFWTIKEACAKALGFGVALDFRRLEVALDPPRILNPLNFLDPGEAFAIDSRLIFIDRSAYCLSVTQIIPATGEASICFKSLIGNRSEQTVGTCEEMSAGANLKAEQVSDRLF